MCLLYNMCIFVSNFQNLIENKKLSIRSEDFEKEVSQEDSRPSSNFRVIGNAKLMG